MSKKERARDGKFSAGLRGRSAEIAALRSLGWTWGMIASHFFKDASLGNASAERFSQEWSRQKRQGMLVNEQKSSDISEELLKDGSLAAGRWVFSFEYENRREQTPASRSGSTPLKEGVNAAKPPVVAPVSDPFPTPVDTVVERAPAEAETAPIVFLPEGKETMEKKLQIGIFKAADFAEHLGFPKPVCELAFMEAKKEPRALATLDRLVGRMVFSKIMKTDPEVRGFIGRLPGAVKWERLKATGIETFETAAKLENNK